MGQLSMLPSDSGIVLDGIETRGNESVLVTARQRKGTLSITHHVPTAFRSLFPVVSPAHDAISL